MRGIRSTVPVIAAIVCQLVLHSSALAAQDGLKVLRFGPDSIAAAVAPVVITFDRPVAPKLSESVDPDTVLLIVPKVGARIFWRDPSTIVAEFDAAWPSGARYQVRVSPGLTSADGKRLVRTAPMTIRVQRSHLLHLGALPPSGNRPQDVGPVPVAVAVYSEPVSAGELTGHVWIAASADCARSDSVAMEVVSIDTVRVSDHYFITTAGGYDRDTRLDSLRRVVTFRAPQRYPRGCLLRVRAPSEIGGVASATLDVRVRPEFALSQIHTPSAIWHARTCEHGCAQGPVTLRFNAPVSQKSVEHGVRANGRPVTVFGNDPGVDWTLRDTVPMGGTLRVRIDSSLTNVYGERLMRPLDTVLTRDPTAPELGYSEGQVIVPSGSRRLLRLRVAYADSVAVIIARVPDSIRARALMHGTPEFGHSTHWPQLASDSVVRMVAVPRSLTSERIIDVETQWIPREWRSDRVLLVRAVPRVIVADSSPVMPPSGDRPGAGVHRLPGVNVRASNLELSNDPRFAVVQRSSLAAHASQHDRILEVWVTRLQTGAPVPGARVRVLAHGTKDLAIGKTDSLGFIELRLGPRVWSKSVEGRRYIEVSDDSDDLLMYLPRERWMQHEPSSSADEDTNSVDLPRHPALRGTGFTDRGAYRPGERVFVKGIARTLVGADGFRAPAGDSARWTISFQDQGPVAVHDGRLSEFGTHTDSFDLDRTARVGTYRADFAVRDGQEWHTVATRTFAIAEYRVPEFAVSVERDTTKRVHAGDTAIVRVRGRYLFGPAMAGGQVTTFANTYQAADAPPSLESLRDYTVGRSWWSTFESAERQSAIQLTNRLDDSGAATLRLPLALFAGPATMRVSVNVQDANRQTIGASLDIPIHAADIYVGIRPTQQRWLRNVGDTIRFELLVAGTDGVVREGTRVDLVATRLEWRERDWTRDSTWRSAVTSSRTAVRAAFVPAKAGWYEVIVGATDESGRRTESAVSLYVQGSLARTPALDEQLSVRMDRARYSPGDTAIALIQAPRVMTALVTMGHEQVLSRQVVGLRPGLNSVRLPLTLAAAPSTDIAVIAVRPMDGDEVRRSPDSLALRASATIEIDESQRALRVGVVPDRSRYRPGDTVRVALDVRDFRGAGRRSEVAVWAVDEGVRSLTGYTSPTLLADLTAHGYRWVSFASTLNALLLGQPPSVGSVFFPHYVVTAYSSAAGLYDQVRVRGVTSATRISDSQARRRFATTPFFAGSVLTDAAGLATTSFVLPDNVTTYHLYAAAVADGVLSGTADTTIVSTRPLIVRAALPRTLRVGDSLLAGAVLTSESTTRTPVSLRIDPGDQRVHGPTAIMDTMEAGRAREHRFPLRIAGRTDTLAFRFDATAGADSDAVEARVPVSPPGKPRARVLMGTLERDASLQLDLPVDFDAARSHATLQVGVSVAPLVSQLGQVLRVYPYHCSEQIASTLRAALAGIRLRRIAGDSSLTESERRQLQLGVNVLLDRQRADGGIGYWSVEHWSSPWLTSYALEALIGARELGIHVPGRAVDKGAEFLRSMTGPMREYMALRGKVDSLNFPSQALHTAVLLRHLGVPDTRLEQQVRGMRKRLNYQDRLVLAELWVASGNRDEASVLLEDAWRSARLEGRRVVLEDSIASRWWIFRSVTGPATALLRATAEIDPGHRLLAPLFESIVQDARSEIGRWNTIDLAAASEAIGATAAQLGVSDPHDVRVSGASGAQIAHVSMGARGSDSVPIPLDAVVSRKKGDNSVRLALSTASSKPTYYALTLFEVPLARPTHADDEGISVERWYENYADGKPITRVAEGELVRVRLRITAPRDREFVVVDDPLPAGLEAVDQSMRTAPNLPPFEGAPKLRADLREGPTAQRWMYGSWDGGWWTPWEHKEIRDDRVLYFARQLWRGSYQASYVARATTAGVFVRPPAQAEEMYNPAVRGRSDGGVFTVTSAPSGSSHP
jgi:alpha-2-macroglobulin